MSEMTDHRITAVSSKVARTAVTALGVLMVTAGCGAVDLSDETQEQGMQAICASSEASISSLRAGGEGARAVASVVGDVATDQRVQNAADAVASGDGADEHIDTLSSWVNERCE